MSAEGKCPECGRDLVRREIVESSHIIIAEGHAENHLLEKLLKNRDVEGFQILGNAQGKDDFENRLFAVSALTGYQSVSVIVLVRDCDDDVRDALKETVKQIKAFDETLPLPENVWELAKSNRSDVPDVAIMTLPRWQGCGCLETLVIDALKTKHPSVYNLGNGLLASATVPASGLTGVAKKAKAQAACMVACTCLDDPSCAVGHMWYKDKGYRSLLADNCFNDVVAFLSSLLPEGPTWIRPEDAA